VRSEEKRPTLRIALAAGVVAIVLSALLTPHVSLALANLQDAPPEFRRVLLRAEQLPAELERVRRGVLRQLPKTGFDDLVTRADAAAAALHDPPRLVEARYRAVLAGESLTGSAAWKVVHRHPIPGLLSLDPFSPALRKAAWDDGSPALIGDFDVRPQAPGVELFVGRPGAQGLTLDWSARGVPGPGGLRFDLRLPPCAVAVLDLDLPADREPAVPREDGLTTGPFPGPAADRRLWKIAFANAPQIDLTIRPTRSPLPPLILAKERTRQELTPGQTSCEFSFDIEAPHGGVRELAVRCDPGFRPTEVGVRNLDGWEVQPPAGGNPSPTILVRLREPLQSGTLMLQGFVPTTTGRAWTSPSASIVGAVPRGEVLTVRVHPDLKLEDWRAGSYRLVESTVTPDRWQVLTLHAGLVRTGHARPVGRLHLAGPDDHVRERLWWTADAARMTLIAQLAFEVARGPVFQVPLRLPAGWEVERIESDPPDLLASADPPPAGPTVTVDFQRPLTPTAAGRLTVHLVRHHPAGGSAEAIAFPDVLPLAGRDRDGVLAVRVGPGLEATVTGAPPVAARPPDREAAPWGDAAPDYVFSLSGPTTEGVLHLSPRPAKYQVRVTSTVRITGSQANVISRLRLQPQVGGPDSFAVSIPGSRQTWDWQVIQGDNRVRSVQPLILPPARLLAALAARSPWQIVAAAGLPADPPPGCWRVTLTRPTTEPIELEAHATLPIEAGGPWTVPLVHVPSAERDGGEVTVDLRPARGWRMRPAWLTDVPTADESPWHRTFRYGTEPAVLTLVPGHDDRARVDRARLETYATDPRQLVQRLSFRLWDWPRLTVPIDLPPDAVVRQVRVNGLAALRASTKSSDDAVRLEVPAPAGTRTLEFDVVYTAPRPAGGLLTRLDIAPPRLPAGGDEVRQLLCLPSDLTPLWLRPWRPTPDDEVRHVGPPAYEAELVPAELTNGTYWQRAGGDEAVWLARPADMTGIGIVLAVVGLLVARAVRSWPARRQWTALVGWIGVSAGAAIGLPGPLAAAAGWPFLAAVLVAVYKLIPPRHSPEPPTVMAPRSSAVRALTGVGIAVVAGLAAFRDGGLTAAAPAPVLVYLVPGPAEAPEPRTVLAAPELVERLRALADRGAGPIGAAWLDARYDGRVNGGQADFTAVLHLHSFTDEPLVLPLTGVQLGEATLDGAAAFPRAAGDRYLVPIHGRGPHSLQIAFSVPCPGPVDERELRFGIPETPISHLSLLGPAGATNLQTLTWRGEQRAETDGDRSRLETDLGGVGMVQARWRQGKTPPNATVRTQEMYLWDLTEMAARLLGAVHFTVAPGTATTLSIALPNELEVAAVAARPTRLPAPAKPGEGETTTGWLRDWRIDPPSSPGGRRSLVLEFAAPISGAWQVNLELVPRGPFGPSFTLPLPSAVGSHSAPPVFGWRAEGVAVSDVPPDSVVPLAGDLFLRDHWLPAKIEADPRPPTKAYQRKTLGAAPAVRVRVVSEGGPAGK
jgi:hypothetical protein